MEKNTEQEEHTEKNEDILEENAPSGNLDSKVEDIEKEAEEEQEDPLKKLQDDLSEAKDKYVRLYAEFDNHRRRTSKEKLDLILNANEQLILSLLPILDDFERAEKSNAEKSNTDIEGFLLIKNKLIKVFDQYGVKAMDITPKSEFNPDFHEAITQVPVPDEKLKGKIVDVIEKGYLLNDKVIRFAKVVIGN